MNFGTRPEAHLHFEEPQRFHAYSELPIEVIINVNGQADLDTFEVRLNENDITDLFEVVDGNTLIGSIGLDDGLIAHSGDRLGGNMLSAEIQDKNGKTISERRLFFTLGLDTSKPDYDGTYVGQATVLMFDSDVRIVIEGNDVFFYANWSGSEIESDFGIIDENGKISCVFEENSSPLGAINISGTLTGDYMSGEYEVMGWKGTWYAVKTEGFESGDFSAFPWETDPSLGWTVTDSEPANGLFAAQAPELYDYESAALEISLECQEGQIQFARKVDSEPQFDFLYFYIDNELKGVWSGNIGYTQSACSGYTPSGWGGYTPSGWSGYTASCDVMSQCTGYTGSGCVGYTVTSGSHTFKWVYSKDDSNSSGSDSAWIDNVQFPLISE